MTVDHSLTQSHPSHPLITQIHSHLSCRHHQRVATTTCDMLAAVGGVDRVAASTSRFPIQGFPFSSVLRNCVHVGGFV